MKKSSRSRRREIFTTFATRSSKNRGVFWKSPRRGRKRSWPIPAVAVHPNDHALSRSDRQTRLAPARARETSDRRRRSDRSEVRHRRSESDARRTTSSISKSGSATSCRSSMCCIRTAGSIVRRCRNWMAWIDSRRARRPRNCCRSRELLAKDGAARKQRWIQRAQRSADRAAPERAMVFALSENEGSARRGARPSDSVLSPALGKGLRAMAGEHSGLVHQPPDLVGPSDSGVVSKPESEIETGTCEKSTWLEPPVDPENWTQDPDTLDTWFSSWLWAYETMDEETRRKFYPTSVLVTGAGHHFLLGRAHDHRRAGIQAGQIRADRRQHSVPRCLSSPA